MARTDDDVEYTKQRIDELMQVRTKRPWNKTLFRDELPNFVGELPSDKGANWRNSLQHRWCKLHDFIARTAYLFVYWHPQAPLDPQAKDILDELLKDRKINKEEWGQAVWQRVLRRADDGVLESAGPKRLAFIIAKLGIATLIIVASAGITEIMVEPFHLFYVLPLAICSGLLIGIFGKLFYQLAWGHNALAKRIRYFSPHYFIRLNILEL